MKNILPTFIQNHLPMQYKTNSSTGRAVYRYQNDFGALDWRGLKNMYPKITDFGSATSIVPRRSFLGTLWGFSADLWNLGVLVSLTHFLNMDLAYLDEDLEYN
ncbi:hypothetical protein P175DRAFT_0528358 [Aspergillus ochraceoroseus IBT 24754]|uniref:Protein kinase domain-containing protein n=1 Tax=Aspergillus ochraceoroseus IBT 24754 TaxID=1392256 RepID=A0A2T5M8I9_9EURO|nr:uncharacterized protein P175DRAFT_0528358 [Aspergillus ochraceoroseus IBT 24754]PTU24847.1 hypothetical protein P175DRAFT_0528358 [Aspergillus ochraceoroseus IBT 24754]